MSTLLLSSGCKKVSSSSLVCKRLNGCLQAAATPSGGRTTVTSCGIYTGVTVTYRHELLSKGKTYSILRWKSGHQRLPKHLTLPTRPYRRTMASLAVHSKKHKVCVVGSGNWGTTISKVIAENVKENSDIFEEEVQMWVREEEVQIPKTSKHYDPGSALCTKPQKLSELVNGLHENIKYLPDIELPKNIVANPDLVDAAKNATILIFNLPHQFIAKTCEQLKGKIVPYARGISCVKGVAVSEKGCELFSSTIGETLGIYCGALSGANIATEVCEQVVCG
jgi:hypothetical protein